MEHQKYLIQKNKKYIMPLPKFKKLEVDENTVFEPLYNNPIHPIYDSLFEVRSSDLPVEVAENIFSYDIDIINKTISLDLSLHQDLLKKLDSLDIYKIEVMHHEKNGEVIFKRIMNDLTYLGYSTKASYDSSDLLNCTVVWSFDKIFNKHS